MAITGLMINHMRENCVVLPMFNTFSFIADGEGPYTAGIEENGRCISSKTVDIGDSCAFAFDCPLEHGKKYTYFVGSGDERAEMDFRTSVILDSKVITTSSETFAPVFYKTKLIDKKIERAELAITGLGLYRAFINGERAGDSYLTPGFNDYDTYLRFQTFDVTSLLRQGANELEIHMGDGWYKGRFGIDKPVNGDKVFGTDYLLCLKLTIEYEGGETETLETDETWEWSDSYCTENSIYDGEVRDYTKKLNERKLAAVREVKYNITPDLGTHVKQKDVLKPVLYVSPKGEQILDFGQNAAGFVRFKAKLGYGQKVSLHYGEILQEGCFYRDNLRTALARCVYIGDGKERVYEPYFTYFGGRYVLVEGLEKVDPEGFEFIVIYSDLADTLYCATDSEKINRLMKNTYWGQRSNFIDVPTDCPQRDERLGWTADTQVFVNTACYQMDTYNFYRKYLHDLRYDQLAYYGGDIPMYSPSLKHEAGPGGAVWADAGTIIPWNVYMNYGDRQLLGYGFEIMKDYCNVLMEKEKADGDNGLILHGFTFGDWLAQDGICEQSLAGGTDNTFITNVYYWNSLRLTASAARELGASDLEKKYSERAEKVYNAILNEYFAPNGKLALGTQTAYVLSLYYGIYRNRDRIINDFRERLRRDFYKMKTGFTGTPLILLAMFDNGMDDDAYRILFNEECPGWLYAVNMGATTVWERWNSVLPDGRISGINMNSLNHYSYGSVCEAIYSRICGLKNLEPGWKKVLIKPHVNYRMKKAEIAFDSPMGKYKVSWKVSGGDFSLKVEIPFGTEGTVELPDGSSHKVSHGEYDFSCRLPEKLVHPFDLDTPNIDILANSRARALFEKHLPFAYGMVTGENEEFKLNTGRFLGYLAMFRAAPEDLQKYEAELKKIEP